jgi:hypothetical protein
MWCAGEAQVKGEWYAPCEHNALIATQVIRMVMCPRVSRLSSVLYIVNPGTALWLRLTAVLATHGIIPAEGVLTLGRLTTRVSPRSRFGLHCVILVCHGRLARAREGCSHVLFPYFLQLLETGQLCGKRISRLSLPFPSLLLLLRAPSCQWHWEHRTGSHEVHE